MERCKPIFINLLLTALVFVCSRVFAEADLLPAEKALRMHEYSRAFKLYYSAANMGDANAQYQLANLYYSGLGVAQSENLGLSWLEKSAQQENSAAQFSLAMKIMNRNQDRAINLIQKAATKEYQPAKLYLQRLGSNKLPTSAATGNSTDSWFAAVRKNNINQLTRIQKDHKSIELEDESGRTALFVALESNSEKSFSWLLQQHANVNHADKFGDMPAFTAIQANRPSMFSKLLNNKVDLHSKLPNGDTLLHYAIRLQRENFANELLQKKIPLNEINKDGWTPLDLAYYQNTKNVFKKLQGMGAKHGNNWVATENQQRSTLKKQFDINKLDSNKLVQILLSRDSMLLQTALQKQEALTNERLEDGSTLLILATKNNDAQAVKILLTAGADAFEKDSLGNDALDIAIRQQNEINTLNLLEYMSKQNSGGSNFNRYFLAAASTNFLPGCIALTQYAEKDAEDQQKRNALWFAAANSNPAMVYQLLKARVPVGAADVLGKTPFYVAVEKDCLKCIEMLSPLAKINQKTVTGNTALIAAASNGSESTIALLLKSKADVNIRNAEGNSALIAAVMADSVEATKLLLASGANPSRKNKLGLSALDIAEIRRNSETLAVLEKKSGLF